MVNTSNNIAFDGQTVKCPICGEPYVFYSHYVGDQSACLACQTRARMSKYTTFISGGSGNSMRLS